MRRNRKERVEKHIKMIYGATKHIDPQADTLPLLAVISGTLTRLIDIHKKLLFPIIENEREVFYWDFEKEALEGVMQFRDLRYFCFNPISIKETAKFYDYRKSMAKSERKSLI